MDISILYHEHNVPKELVSFEEAFQKLGLSIEKGTFGRYLSGDSQGETPRGGVVFLFLDSQSITNNFSASGILQVTRRWEQEGKKIFGLHKGTFVLHDVRDHQIQWLLSQEHFSKSYTLGHEIFQEDASQERVRVFCVGGMVHSAVRIDEQHQFHAIKELQTSLAQYANDIASAVNEPICVIDFTFSSDRQAYIFEQIRNDCWWQGAQIVDSRDMFSDIAQVAHSFVARSSTATEYLVRHYYEYFQELLPVSDRFHYHSRLWLWSQSSISRDFLNSYREQYIDQYQSITDGASVFLKRPNRKPVQEVQFYDRRKQYFDRYPLLYDAHDLLFWNMMAKAIYDVDLHNTVRSVVSDDDLVILWKSLHTDGDALSALSTFAINTLYMIPWHLQSLELAIHPWKLLDLSRQFFHVDSSDAVEHLLHLYFLTHCIIGESHFYQDRVSRHLDVYHEMLGDCEHLIEQYYRELSFDSKIEFLVCVTLCEYTSKLSDRIVREAQELLSRMGNYLVDSNRARFSKNMFGNSEHRNVLYILYHLPFQKEHFTKK